MSRKSRALVLTWHSDDCQVESICLAREVLRCDRFEHRQGERLGRFGVGSSTPTMQVCARVPAGGGPSEHPRVRAFCASTEWRQGAKDVEKAVAAAREAFPSWARTSEQAIAVRRPFRSEGHSDMGRTSKTFGTATRLMSPLLDVEWQGTSKAACHPAHLNHRLAQTCRHCRPAILCPCLMRGRKKERTKVGRPAADVSSQQD